MPGRNNKHIKNRIQMSLQTDPRPGFMGRRELKKRAEELARRGISEGDILKDRMPAKYISVLLRGLLIFLAAYGTVWGLACSFDLAYDPVKVFAGILILSIFSASIYYNRLTFYIGYVVMFVSFFVYSVSRYAYINSGFQALINEINEHYVDYFSLPALRVSEEMIADRSLTVPIALIFIGWVYCIMLNVTISSYMNPILTFVITFLPLQAAFYIDIMPPYLCITMLIMCYVSVLVLSRAGYYALPYRYKKYELFSRRRKKKGFEDFYILSAKGMLSVFLVSLAISLAFFVVVAGVFGDSFSTKYISNKIKNKTDDYVEIVVMNGIMSIFNRYEARGGLARGRLGGIGSVAPDYETDLEITYVPTSTDTVYLRAFVGDKYSVDRFNEAKNEFDPVNEIIQSEGEAGAIVVSDPLNELVISDGEIYEMEINNKDADADYYYLPYHSQAATGDKDGVSVITYIPETGGMDYPMDREEMYPYTEYAFINYLSVPESLIPTLDDVVKKGDLITDLRGNEGILDCCYRLQKYFAENYRYSLQPGRTPMGRDVVGYFLTSQDRGYCMHYASSATLILRYLGIPARYCEGYVITASDLSQGEIVGEENGKSKVKVEITDASAHAWVEVYMINYGWIPYEMTPPSFGDDSSADMRSLMGILSGLFTVTSRQDETEGNTGDVAEGAGEVLSRIGESIEFLIKPLGYCIALILLIILMRPLIRLIYSNLLVYFALKSGRYSDAFLMRYRAYTGKLVRQKLIKSCNSDPVLISGELSLAVEDEDIKDRSREIAYIAEKAAFSEGGISLDEYESSIGAVRSVIKEIKRMQK